jgi:hypothetical protein
MTAAAHPDPRSIPAHRIWVPRQHGAWAMLAVPLLLGIAASEPSPWQLVLAGAAYSGFLASASAQTWSRARRAPAYRLPVVAYTAIFAILSLALVVAFPALLLTLVVFVPASVVVFGGARPGTRRDLSNSLAQVAQALVLVPAAAYVSGQVDPGRILAYSVVAGAFLVGTVLVVRSVLRERGNDRFAGLSIGFHLVVAALMAVAYPWPYAVLALGLAVRAVGLPLAQRRWAGGSHPLRPIQVGLVEAVASLAVVVVSFTVRLPV